jgi:hypothetical protein
MSPHGRAVGIGRYPYWIARVRPFYDSDEEREILFYQTDPLAEGVRTCFGPTFWLARECHYWPAVGTVIGSEQVAPDATHDMSWGDPIGDPDWLVHGISRERLVAGDYGPGAPLCPVGPGEAQVGRVAVEVLRATEAQLAEVQRVAVEVIVPP